MNVVPWNQIVFYVIIRVDVESLKGCHEHVFQVL